ncbi:bifunctional metallophosphatase/5'-nucleotidase [Halorussus pelagicus]|uniref:bifunctional metallophosphatase/5'-nucleotidase n=1 Tax=Halorussus pelagicus TaxID=2505977 RepID=UPI000FFC1DDC|nr:bifunctional metallophosphatase/5'-nucleotidase [Halorussus pelagicus]
MSLRVLHYSDIENAYDDAERVGRLAGTIDALRDDRTVVVGTGDDTAPGVLALRTDGRQSLEFFDAVEPDLETFGNHDFDFGTDPLRDIVADSPQQWVSANVYAADGTDRQFADAPAATVVERGGERVGFVGVTDPKTPEISAGASELTVTDPVAEVREVLPALRERADHVVVLAHLRGETERAIAEFDGVDAVLGGHVHTERHDRVNGTLLLRPSANGQMLWEVELGDRATATRHAVPDGPRDDAVAGALRDRMEATGLTEVVGHVEEPIARSVRRHYGGECRVANLVTDAYRWATGADVAYTQSGGLRDGPALAGEVTVADLIGVSPFGGELRTAVLTGAQLRELASEVYAPDDSDGRTWWGHFGGVEIAYDSADGRVCEVRFDGDPVDPVAEFSVATNAYVVEYGTEPISPECVVDSFGIQYDAIVEYAREEGLDVDVDGRLLEV